MQKYIQYIIEFHNSNPVEIDFIKNHLKKYLETHEENQTEIETILDYLFSNTKVDISKIGYTTILKKTEKWHKKLQSVAIKDTEIEWEDYEVYMDFWDGFKIVKLISKSCYEREWKLMSHCVASYYGRDTIIYSLRDSKNLPHCTIEDGNQIKWKWNGHIDPKYIDYIVKFLEKTGMSVWENEMKNLWYHKIEKIDKYLTSECAYNGYIYEGKMNTLLDKDGRIYKGMWIFDVLPVCDIEDDGKFRLYDDIKWVVAYENLVMEDNGHSTRNASSWHYTRNASSWDYTQNASSWNSTRNASSWDYTQNASSWNSTRNASSGHSTQNASSGDSTQNASSGDYTRNASSWHYTRSEVNGRYGITADIGNGSRSKWVIGTWIVLAEYEKNTERYWYPKYVKCGQIDGIALKENTWYKLENWEFTETE